MPNLQRMLPNGRMARSDDEIPTEPKIDEWNGYFYQGKITPLPRKSVESLGVLLVEFFYFYAFEFEYKNTVVSIRKAPILLTKQEKGWTRALVRESGKFQKNELFSFCVEDPFNLNHNLARTSSVSNIYDLKQEFKRAHSIISTLKDANTAITELIQPYNKKHK